MARPPGHSPEVADVFRAVVIAGSAKDGATKPTHRPAARSKRRKIKILCAVDESAGKIPSRRFCVHSRRKPPARQRR